MCHMVEEPEITLPVRCGNYPYSPPTARNDQKVSLRISAYAAARLARTQRFQEARRRGTDRASVRSVTAKPASCIVSDFEWDRVQPNTSFWAELSGAMFSKAGDCLRDHRAAADGDNHGGLSISRLMAQSRGLRRALTPGRIRCLFYDRQSQMCCFHQASPTARAVLR